MGNQFVHDQSQVTYRNSSGGYATHSGASGQWIGFVTGHTIDEEQNYFRTRYAGAASRSVSKFTKGVSDVVGTLEYVPQTWQFLGYALGSIVDGGSPSPYTHTYKEADTDASNIFTGEVLPDFEIEDFQDGGVAGSNFVRTVKGAMVNTFTIDIAEKDQVKVSVDYLAQDVTYSSGASLKTAEATTPEFMAEHFTWHLPSGTVVNGVGNSTIEINNNLEGHHFITGSSEIQVPIPTNREYTVTLNVMDKRQAKALYNQYFKGGSTFNLMANGVALTGSHEVAMVWSGCVVADMDAPTAGEGIAAHSVTIVPRVMSAIAIDTTQFHLVGSHA